MSTSQTWKSVFRGDLLSRIKPLNAKIQKSSLCGNLSLWSNTSVISQQNYWNKKLIEAANQQAIVYQNVKLALKTFLAKPENIE